MVTAHILGRILPEEPKISIANLPSLTWLWQERGFSIDFKISIQNSLVDIECALPDYKLEYLAELHRRAFDLARAAVNLAAFSYGYGLIVCLDGFIDPNGNRTTLLPEDKRLPPLCTAFNGPNGFDQVLRIVILEPILIRLLSDLIQAITIPHETTTSCARAIDGLKHLIATPGSSDKVAWEKMRDVLQVDEAYLKFVTDSSKDGRHGKDKRIEGNITSEVAVRSWNVMNRYFEYRKRGNAPLSVANFPLLKG